jgi:hypothetical protein
MIRHGLVTEVGVKQFDVLISLKRMILADVKLLLPIGENKVSDS